MHFYVIMKTVPLLHRIPGNSLYTLKSFPKTMNAVLVYFLAQYKFLILAFTRILNAVRNSVLQSLSQHPILSTNSRAATCTRQVFGLHQLSNNSAVNHKRGTWRVRETRPIFHVRQGSVPSD